MNMKMVIFGAILLTAFVLSTSIPCAAAGEPLLLNGSARLNSSESMNLKNGYVLTVKEFEFNTTTAAKKAKLVLYRNGAVVDEKAILSEDVTKDIGTYIYNRTIGGKIVKIIRADLDMWVDELYELVNPGKLSRGVVLSKVYQYWDGESQVTSEAHIRFLWVKGAKSYSLKEGTLNEKIYENNVTLNTRSGIALQHNQMYNESFDARNSAVEISKSQSTVSYPSGKNFQGERKYLVILDEDNSFPIMNEDDIFICRAGELSDPSVTYNISETGSVSIVIPSGERSTLNFTVPDWGATEAGYIYQNPLTASIQASSNPGGASIYVDSLPVGKAPALLQDIPFGARIIEMQLENQTRWRYVLNLTADAIKPVCANGVRYVLGTPNGALNINSTPGGAKIYIDGYFTYDAPRLISGIPPGEYSIELQLEGYQNWTKKVTAADHTVTNVIATLQAGTPTSVANVTATAAGTQSVTPIGTPKGPGFEGVAGILALVAASALAIARRKI